MGTIVVLGAQWGDEGKGKLVDILSESIDLCARCQGGNNAGHTIVRNGKTYEFHLLPSGLLNPKCTNLIGTGVVLHVPSFFKELAAFKEKGLDGTSRVFISDRAHVVFDLHQMVDGIEETALAEKSVGTTRKGIGPTYSTKAARTGVRVAELFDWDLFESKLRTLARSYKAQYGDLLQYDVEKELEVFKELVPLLKPYVVDSMSVILQAEQTKKTILVEGANAIMLDLDWGTYPYVTSSNTGIGGVFTGLGLNPLNLKQIIGVVKAYTTRVGWGPMPTEQLNEVGERLQTAGREFGVTTGRKRRCGWLDMFLVRYSAALNHYTSINITKLDVLDGFPELKVCVGYSYNGKKLDSFPADLSILEKVELEYKIMPGWQTPTRGCKTFKSLPLQAQEYVEFIERFIGVKAEFIGTGPERECWIHR